MTPINSSDESISARKGLVIVPRRISETIAEIGGKTTPYGAAEFLRKSAEIRSRVLREKKRYHRVNLDEMDYRGSLSQNAADYAAKSSKRKGNKMPKLITLEGATFETLNGQRGRKAVFPNWQDFALDIGVPADITEEMTSELLHDDYDGEITPDMLFANDGEGLKYRKNRFANVVTAARKNPDCDKAKYSLLAYTDENGNKAWAIRRDS